MLLAERAEPAVAALRAFRAAVFAGTALGRPIEGTLAAVKRTTLADVRATYASFGPGNAALVAVGAPTRRGGGGAAVRVRDLAGRQGARGGPTGGTARRPSPSGVRGLPRKAAVVLVVGQPAVRGRHRTISRSRC